MIIENKKVTNIKIDTDSVVKITDQTGIVLWKKEEVDYSKEYFTFEDMSGSADAWLGINRSDSSVEFKPSYSYDKINWIKIEDLSHQYIIPVPPNGKVYLKSNGWGKSDGGRLGFGSFYDYKVSGNIMSLLYEDEFIDKTELIENYCFSYMFYNQLFLKSIKNLVLPATTLTDYCYAFMFSNCQSLTEATELPATTLATGCYQDMFGACTSLTEAPSLPATELTYYCYNQMFYNCTSLTEAPSLSATTLAENCYGNMFGACTSLTKAPSLPATELSSYCYQYMFQYCSSLTAAPELPATELSSYCYQYMFRGCSSLTTAPELSATTLATYCYQYMFRDCTSLTEAPALPARTLIYACYFNMFYGCTSLNKVTTYANNISATACLSDWLYNVSPTGDFYNLGTATYPSGGSGIPEGWTNTYPQFVDVTAVPSVFSLKSYQRYIQCNYTLIKTLEGGIQVTEQGSHTVETGKNTGDEPRAIVETVHENPLATITIIQTANDPEPPTTYIVLKPDDVTYGFENHGSGYYESTNQGINNSYSYVIVHYKGFETLRLSCINYAESNYDYGMISKEDVMLTKGYNSESDTNLTKSFKGLQSPDPVIVTIPSDGGEHFITIKYIKDSSDHKNYDSLQFKVLED